MSDPTTGALIRRLVNQVATGVVNINTLVRAGIAGHFHANFDRVAGGHHVDPRDDNKRVARLARPGAILLANLDTDEDTNPLVPRARFGFNQADAQDAVVNFQVDDDLDISEFAVAEPDIVIGNASRVNLRLHATDQARVRIWSVTATAANLQAGPPAVQVVIGPGVAAHHEVRNILTAPPPAGWQQRFVLEALTLPGDPGLPHPAAPPPRPPGVYRTPLAATSGGSEAAPQLNATNSAQAVYATRAAGDVWLELIHDLAGASGAAPGAGDPSLLDVALFTIAPWIMTWNGLPCERIYVCKMREAVRPPRFRDALHENHAMVYDLHAACAAAGFCPAPNVNTSNDHVVSAPGTIRARNDVPFYIIDPAHSGIDRWAQDELEIGYCYAPHNWMHVVLHMPRNRLTLGVFVSQHMSHPGMGVFEAISAAGGGAGQDCGGNLEVSPPVPNPTPAIAHDRGGPSVKAHRAAPLGKIIFGDYARLADSVDGRAFAPLRDFFIAQRVQPLLPLNTAWLRVGHVDEFLSFVPATDARGFKLLLADVRLMTRLLQEVVVEDADATLHAGKYVRIRGLGVWAYAEDFVEDWVDPISYLRRYSETVERDVFARIRARLRAGLDLTEAHIVPVPTYWKNPGAPPWGPPLGAAGNTTIAENVGMVNLQVVNRHLMVPRPYGPRLRRDRAERAVGRVLEQWFGIASAPPVVLPPAGIFTFWARPGESVEAIAMYFAGLGFAGATQAWRTAIIDAIGPPVGGGAPAAGTLAHRFAAGVRDMHGDGVRRAIRRLRPPSDQRAQIATVAANIRLANLGLPAANLPFPEWRRIDVPDGGTVDAFEVYMKSVLEPLGNTVHFVEDFESYHEKSGEVHCGTNAKRTPPELDPAFVARWWDRGVYDPDYDTSYNPTL